MNLLSHFGQTSNDMYPVDMSATTGSAVAVGIIIFALFFLILTYVVYSYLLSRIFNKAGVPGWKAWVPVYSTWATLELGGKDGRWSLLMLAPLAVSLIPITQDGSMVGLLLSILAFIASLAGVVFLYIAMHNIGVRFGKEEYFILWAIFLPIVWYVWLAFDKSTWQKPLHTTPHHPHTNESNL